MDVRDYRKSLGVIPSYKRVDTCAAEFQADTPYMYSTYDGNDECNPTTERKVGDKGPSFLAHRCGSPFFNQILNMWS